MAGGKIPSGWLNYTPLGKPIQGTRFLAFKVPLKKPLCSQVPESEHFTPEILLETLKSSGWKLGLVIDLTNTKRYYDPKVFEDLGIKYQKIFTEGKVVPSDQVKMKFLSVVDEFTECNPEEDLLIGVHCTHGLNRTGHLVCRYMVDRLGFEPENAINLYNEARGYKIERENYLNDVKTCPTDMEKYETYKVSGCPSPKHQTNIPSVSTSASSASADWTGNNTNPESNVSCNWREHTAYTGKHRWNPNPFPETYRWSHRNRGSYSGHYTCERQDRDQGHSYSNWNRRKYSYNNNRGYNRGRSNYRDEYSDTRHYGYQYRHHDNYNNKFHSGCENGSENDRYEPYSKQITGNVDSSSNR